MGVFVCVCVRVRVCVCVCIILLICEKNNVVISPFLIYIYLLMGFLSFIQVTTQS